MAISRGVIVTALLLALCAAPSEQDVLVTVAGTTTPAPPTSSPSTTTTPPLPSDAPAPGGNGRPDVYSLHITSNIRHRYARTLVTSRLANRADTAQEAQFSLVLPETAFISAFLIETEGKVYEAYVKEKEEAKKEYDAALAGGQTAAHVGVSARDANTFEVSVNLAARQKATFNLTYEELLTRKLGAYAHAVHVAPGQPVADLRAELLVAEAHNITKVHAAFLPADAQPEAADNDAASADADSPAADKALSVEKQSDGATRVVFAPSTQQQKDIAKSMGGSESAGLTGQLVLRYDVDRPAGGEVLLDQGYFVHFFAPENLPPLPKHVIFVLDVSGSMLGRKVQQLKEAMTAILGDLRPGDYFSLIEFSYSVTVWNLDSASNNVVYSPYAAEDSQLADTATPAAYPATPDYIKRAQGVVAKLTAGGGTNIHDALRTALAVARGGLHSTARPPPTTTTPIADSSSTTPDSSSPSSTPSTTTAAATTTRQARSANLKESAPPQPIIVFLTDGEPTVGESRPHKILEMVSERNNPPPSAIFSLAFGDDADLPFLKKLSLRNSGFARKIYEAADAALQLKNFYQQVASPLLANVTFEYTEANTTQVTQKRFPTYFGGGELVVAGRWWNSDGDAPGAVVAQGDSGEQRFAVSPPMLPPPVFWLPPPPRKDEDASGPGSRRHAPSLERLWAYLSVRQLLEERDRKAPDADGAPEPAPEDGATEAPDRKEAAAEAEKAKKRALELALQYSFVTPLTSLVVVKPNASSSATDLQSARPNRPQWGFAAGAPFSGGGGGGGGGGYGGGGFPAQPALAFAPGLPPARPTFAAYSTTRFQPTWTTPAPTSTIGSAAESSSTSASSTVNVSTSSTDSSTAAPVALGALSDLVWLTNALNGTTGSLLVPLGNGTRLLRLGVGQENQAFEACALPEGAGSVAGPAHCRHLPHCVLPDIRQDMQSYVRYFCSIDDFAGVCCPDSAFSAASVA